MDEQLRDIIDVDRIVHEPARLAILAVLWAVESADFLYLLHATDLTRGNLSSHLSKLEDSGYVEIEKTFEGKMPRTLCRLTDSGREAFESYREQMRTFLAG
ncbi:MAG: transcriptional regulator [Anaerolineales bacterium]